MFDSNRVVVSTKQYFKHILLKTLMVLGRNASLEEQHEREAIYTNHLETQADLVTVTTVVTDSSSPSDPSGFDVVAGGVTTDG